MHDLGNLRHFLSANIFRRQNLAIVIGATLAISSSAFAVDITGQNGWVQEGQPGEPITVTTEMPYDGNGSLTFGLANWGYGQYDGPAAQLTTPVTSGMLTISFKYFLPTNSGATFVMGVDGGASNPNSNYQTDIEGTANAQDDGTWDTYQTVIDLDTANAPFTTTINGGTPSWGDSSFNPGDYSAGAAPVATEIWFYLGPGENAAPSADFYLDDLSAVSSVDGTVFFDNFDSYIAVPEPASLSMIGLAGAALMGRRRRKA